MFLQNPIVAVDDLIRFICLSCIAVPIGAETFLFGLFSRSDLPHDLHTLAQLQAQNSSSIFRAREHCILTSRACQNLAGKLLAFLRDSDENYRSGDVVFKEPHLPPIRGRGKCAIRAFSLDFVSSVNLALAIGTDSYSREPNRFVAFVKISSFQTHFFRDDSTSLPQIKQLIDCC